jgi:hypothetical protein
MALLSPVVMGVTAGTVMLPALIGEVTMLIQSWPDILKYLEGTQKPSEPPSKALTTKTPTSEEMTATIQSNLGDLTPVDGVLVTTSAAGLILLTIPAYRWYGLLSLLGSFLISQTRDNARNSLEQQVQHWHW